MFKPTVTKITPESLRPVALTGRERADSLITLPTVPSSAEGEADTMNWDDDAPLDDAFDGDGEFADTLADDGLEGLSHETVLLYAAQGGDYEAFGALQLILEPEVRRFVWRLVGDSEADDVTQEVFVALFKNLDQIDPPAKLRPFVFRVARHRSYDALRRRGRYDPVTLDDEPLMEWISLVNAEVGRPEEIAHWLLIHLEVQEAMERLPELQRQTLILYAEEGLSYAEIAEIMETTVGTVKSRLHYAKKTLRQLLRPETLKSLDEELSA